MGEGVKTGLGPAMIGHSAKDLRVVGVYASVRSRAN